MSDSASVSTFRRVAQAPPLLLLDVYRWAVSPVLSSLILSGCRFEPTCSHYASTAIRRFGVLRGARLGIVRLLRCRPGGGWGYDPVPLNAPKSFLERR